jgi:hypothetical protein
MQVATDVVAKIVAEASTRMTEANYSAVMVGGFVRSQGPTAEYIKAHAAELGGPAGVVNTIFHAALIALCFQRGHGGRVVRKMTFEDLDRAAVPDRDEALARLQPAIHGYIEANVEAAPMQRVLQLIALTMDWVS